MAEPDTRRWSLRDAAQAIRNANVPTAMLARWAEQGVILPGFAISADGETWAPAETLPELGMTWYVLAPGRPPYGPLARPAAERLIAEGRFPKGAALSQDPGGQAASAELPLVLEPSADSRGQELEETRQRLVLLERELRLKDRRIDELRREAEARQSELAMEGATDAGALAQQLEGLRLEHAHLQAAAQEAAEAAASRERELRQRIASLETALGAAQEAAASNDLPPDEALFAVLSREAETLRRGQEEEERLVERLRELSRQRSAQFADRLAEIRRLAGEGPEAMRANALRGGARPAPKPKEPARVEALEKALEEARGRESALQRQLVSMEGREAQLRAQLGQAERQTLDSLRLDEKLRETVQALERERAAREEEHRENERVQAQLLRRIEELERLARPMGGEPVVSEPAGEPPARGTFGWLRKR